MNKPLVIDYYTDVLCVWAWIAQRRIDELNSNLKDKIELEYYFVDVFGDVPTKMDTQWKERGGYEGYAEHVQKSAAVFEHAFIDPDVWKAVRPSTSANAHLMVKAVEKACGKSHGIDMALAVRKAFFMDARDIGDLEVLFALAEANGLDKSLINKCIQDGTAMAALMHDYQKSKQLGIKGSPSYVIDNGRQTLYGNVGYRVLQANVEELLKRPTDEASWC
jgi:predicted DsbA family dithiol-disulfide isomerase